jgi:hypothetical protein
MVELLTFILVGLVAGLLTTWFIYRQEPEKLLTFRTLGLGGLFGLMGAFVLGVLAAAIGDGLGIRLSQSASVAFPIIGAVVTVLGWANFQRSRQARREAKERATEEKQTQQRYASVRSKLDEGAREEEATRTRIFISYRREDGAAQAGRIADLLGHEFGPDHVFMDVDAIALGVDFVEVINVEVAKCDVLLALIGRNWLEARNEAGERVLDNPDDFVRLEIAAALKRQIPVIPILVDGAKIPPANRLPEELQGLARRNALDLRNASFRADMDKLVRQLKTSKGS